jgi:hypothetical protein
VLFGIVELAFAVVELSLAVVKTHCCPKPHWQSFYNNMLTAYVVSCGAPSPCDVAWVS